MGQVQHSAFSNELGRGGVHQRPVSETRSRDMCQHCAGQRHVSILNSIRFLHRLRKWDPAPTRPSSCVSPTRAPHAHSPLTGSVATATRPTYLACNLVCWHAGEKASTSAHALCSRSTCWTDYWVLLLAIPSDIPSEPRSPLLPSQHPEFSFSVLRGTRGLCGDDESFLVQS